MHKRQKKTFLGGRHALLAVERQWEVGVLAVVLAVRQRRVRLGRRGRGQGQGRGRGRGDVRR